VINDFVLMLFERAGASRRARQMPVSARSTQRFGSADMKVRRPAAFHGGGSCVAAARSLANLDVARTGSPSRTGASRPVWPDCRAHCWALAAAKGVSVIKVSRSIKGAKVTFALPADESAAGCSVVGDFNGWRPGMHQLRRRSNGTRSASVVLPLGTRTRFRYLGNNGHWFSDPDVLEFDGLDSVLAV
jgi:hypothetical protein